MARQTSDKEDLMAEAVTLLPRLACRIPSLSDEIVAGRRADGRWSVFFGSDPVYHFDAEHRLRRAFARDLLYRSQGTTLARLTRQESQQETVLLRHDLSSPELTLFLQQTRQHLQLLEDAITNRSIQIVSQIPADTGYLADLAATLENMLQSDITLSPALTRR